VTEDYYNWTFEEYTRKQMGDLDLALKYLANASEIINAITSDAYDGTALKLDTYARKNGMLTRQESIQHEQAAFALTNAEMSLLDAVEAITGSRARFARLLPHDGGITSPGTRPQGMTNG